jgi:hypothetical protein
VKLAPRSSRIEGSATLTTVMSSSSMNVATETAISVHHLRSTECHLLDEFALSLGTTDLARDV